MVREEEWTFAYKFKKVLDMRLKDFRDTFREKRRAALLGGGGEDYILIVNDYLDEKKKVFDELILDLED